MAGNYRKRNSTRRRISLVGPVLLSSFCFVAGYMSASLYNLTSVSTWISTHLLAKETHLTLTRSNAQVAQLPKPKFEFYTLLANDKLNVPTIAVVEPTKVARLASPHTMMPVPETQVAAVVSTESDLLSKKIKSLAANNSRAYLIQVASFKSMREAERMKVSLVMKGFDVNIATVNQQNMKWYRVIIGPFASRLQAQSALVAFSQREHIRGMIRRMDA